MPQDATPLALVVRFTVRPGHESDFDRLVARTVAGIRAHEPGTLVYAVHEVDGAPRERIFYEGLPGRARCPPRRPQSALQRVADVLSVSAGPSGSPGGVRRGAGGR